MLAWWRNFVRSSCIGVNRLSTNKGEGTDLLTRRLLGYWSFIPLVPVHEGHWAVLFHSMMFQSTYQQRHVWTFYQRLISVMHICEIISSWDLIRITPVRPLVEVSRALHRQLCKVQNILQKSTLARVRFVIILPAHYFQPFIPSAFGWISIWHVLLFFLQL
jgi:hypothetical protein